MSPSIIDTKYLELGEPDFLGKPTKAESKSHDGKGKFRQYENGAIYLAPDAERAYEVHGEIFKKWSELNFESGVLGYPITDQRRMSDGVGRYSEFVNGIIYWSPETGAHSVRGSILSKYRVFGGPQGILGYPNANTIVVNTKPSVSISSPASGATFIGPATINITAAASDVNGTVSKVEFYQGAVKLGEDTIAPYSFSWTNVAVGNYALTAKATDNHGGVSTSSSVSVTVNANSLPTVSITNPLNNVMFPAPASITIYASAADSDGTINKVEFFQGATLIGTATTNPYTLIWSNVAAGTYSVTAKATDNLGATRTSTAVNVIVNSLPAITITSPANNSSFTAPVNTVINVNASDANGTVSKVEFFDGATKLGESLAAPFSFNWNAVPLGTHTLTAKATDNQGGVTTSASVVITVTSPYSYRRAITIDHTKVPNTDLSNFPLLVKGTYPYLATVSNGGSVQNANGYDVIFTSDSGCSTKLDHEVETYSASTGTVNYWVKVPLLSHSTDTVIYMCYGSSTITTDQSNKTGVWDANYKAVYHLKDGTTLNVTDATANHNLTNNGATATTGQVDGAGNFNGSTQYLSLAAHSNFSWTNLRTIEFWVKLGNTTQTIPRLYSYSDGGSDAWNITWKEPSPGFAGGFLIVSLGAQAVPAIQKQTPDNGPINSTTAWHHVVVVSDGTTVSSIYINGNPVTLSNYTGNITNTTTSGLNIGRRNDNARYFNGALDEIRFSNSQRSADWIRTGYNNQSSPSTFYTISGQETVALNTLWPVQDWLGKPSLFLVQRWRPIEQGGKGNGKMLSNGDVDDQVSWRP